MMVSISALDLTQPIPRDVVVTITCDGGHLFDVPQISSSSIIKTRADAVEKGWVGAECSAIGTRWLCPLCARTR